MKRSDLLLFGVAAVLALPVYRGPFRHGGSAPSPSERRTIEELVVAVPALFADHTPRAPVQVRGQDSFDGNSLPDYSGSSDRGGESWTIRDGSLIGTSPAQQSVLTHDHVHMADGWVEAVSSRADDGGLVLRYRGPTDYYLLTFRDDQAPAPRGGYNLAIYHRIGSELRELWRGSARWTRGTGHAIRFEADDRRLRAYFDGAPVGEVAPSPAANDPAPYFGRGKIGVWNYGRDSSWMTRFAAFRWQGVDRKR